MDPNVPRQSFKRREVPRVPTSSLHVKQKNDDCTSPPEFSISPPNEPKDDDGEMKMRLNTIASQTHDTLGKSRNRMSRERNDQAFVTLPGMDRMEGTHAKGNGNVMDKSILPVLDNKNVGSPEKRASSEIPKGKIDFLHSNGDKRLSRDRVLSISPRRYKAVVEKGTVMEERSEGQKLMIFGPKLYVVYTIRVNRGDESWTIKRRYNDFLTLNQKLGQMVDPKLLPYLTGK